MVKDMCISVMIVQGIFIIFPSTFDRSKVGWHGIYNGATLGVQLFSRTYKHKMFCSLNCHVLLQLVFPLFMVITFDGTISTEHLQLPRNAFFLWTDLILLSMLLFLLLFEFLFRRILRSCNAISGIVTRPTRKRLHKVDFRFQLLMFVIFENRIWGVGLGWEWNGFRIWGSFELEHRNFVMEELILEFVIPIEWSPCFMDPVLTIHKLINQ